ncbi:hypothetical protein Mal64_24080 [Pseudobythopirellula maris]|uniref:Pilus assembly protein, PilO n=1 Tax=Pseudobythopirellula maris TaxID=2527991 RepID=A0A5C5ZP09_9BACT|nr:type 4a pilus biogenesis protein PilO [Pseudobythopirellula maris]TWT88918.1 hypothetical protein Mal64_24080 [Pseudobythopirellula maris]
MASTFGALRLNVTDRLAAGGRVAVNGVCAAICLTGLAFEWRGVYAPIAADTRHYRERTDQLVQMVGESVGIDQKHQRLNRVESEIQEALGDTLARLPDTPLEADFARQLRQHASSAGFGLTQLAVGSRVERDATGSVVISCGGQANHAELCDFLARVHQGPRIATVGSLTVSANDNPRRHSFEIQFNLHYRIKPRDTESTEDLL